MIDVRFSVLGEQLGCESRLGWRAYKGGLALRVQRLDNSTGCLLVRPDLEKDPARGGLYRREGEDIAVVVIQRIRGLLGPQVQDEELPLLQRF